VPSGPRRSDAPTQGRRAREIATSSRSPAHGWPGRPGTSAAPTLRPPPPRHRPAAGAPGSTGTGERGLRSSTRAPPAQPHRAQAPQQRPGGPSAPRRGLRMVLMPRPGPPACPDATAAISAGLCRPAPGRARAARLARRRAAQPSTARARGGPHLAHLLPGGGSRAALGHAQARATGRAAARRGGRALGGPGPCTHQTPGARHARTARTGAGSGTRPRRRAANAHGHEKRRIFGDGGP
jgi:hypothetical protein